jgi:hypothetical protein
MKKNKPQKEKPQPQEEWKRAFYKIYNEEKGNIVRDLKLIDFISNLISEIRKEERERIIKEFERAIISRMPAFSPNEKVTELKLFSLKDLAELIKKINEKN